MMGKHQFRRALLSGDSSCYWLPWKPKCKIRKKCLKLFPQKPYTLKIQKLYRNINLISCYWLFSIVIVQSTWLIWQLVGKPPKKPPKNWDSVNFFQAVFTHLAMHVAAWYGALVPFIPVFHTLKACSLAVMTSPIWSFHHQVSQRQWWGLVVPHTSSVVLRRPVLMSFHISSVAASGTPADTLTCKLKTSWKWFLLWGSFSFQTLRRGMNLPLGFGGTSNLMWHTRSWCCRAASLPGITFTPVTSLHIAPGKRMKTICVAVFTYLYVMRWLSRFSPSISSSGL